MAEIILVKVNWDKTAVKLEMDRHYYNLAVCPEPCHPFGQKGMWLQRAWQQLGGYGHAGMLVLDGDVAIDRYDHEMMISAIHFQPDMVHVAPARIWPVSTRQERWTWAHWSSEPSQVLETEDVKWFSFNYTYLPRKVIERAIKDGLPEGRYPFVDTNVCLSAQRCDAAVNVVITCQPKHLHY